jgi:hypothetical protein
MPASEPVQPAGRILLALKETPAMFARRFTIVCLLTTLFGMAFAVLVAQADRQPRTWDGAGGGLCRGILCSSR